MWKKRLLVLLIPGIFATIVDRLSKIWAVETLKEQPMQSYLNDLFRLVYAENTGAFLSLGSGMNDTLRYWVLAIVPVVVLLYIFIHVLTAPHLHKAQQAAFGFILGGGLSNIYDRIMEGRVVDFMNMGIGNLRTGIFNVADMSIMLGLFMMVPFLFQPSAQASPSPAVPTPSDEVSEHPATAEISTTPDEDATPDEAADQPAPVQSKSEENKPDGE